MAAQHSITATPNRLAMRAGICQLTGTVIGVATGSAIGAAYNGFGQPVTGSWTTDLLAVASVALVALGLPFFAVVMLLLTVFTRQILGWPFLWCVVAPGLLLVLALWLFPLPVYHGFHWIALIPLCATFAGLLFYGWQLASPLEPANLTGA